MKVTLTNGEAFDAAMSGVARRLRAISRDRQLPGGWDRRRKNGRWENDIQAAAAEKAFAKAMGLYWADSPDPEYDGDVGGWQVRSITDPSYNLLLYAEDPDEKPVALVCGEIPEFEVVGWIRAGDGKREEWRSGERLERGGWIVPRSALTQFVAGQVAA